jgi:Fur family iron response transcriptional regulator
MDLIATLHAHDIQPSVQRVAVARYVLQTHEHPSADVVWTRVKAELPVISRATVYNTLHLFAEKGLVRELALAENCVVFDPKMEPHHHFVDDDTGAISDIPWEALRVKGVDALAGFTVREHQVVLRGKAKRARSAQRKSTARI